MPVVDEEAVDDRAVSAADPDLLKQAAGANREGQIPIDIFSGTNAMRRTDLPSAKRCSLELAKSMRSIMNAIWAASLLDILLGDACKSAIISSKAAMAFRSCFRRRSMPSWVKTRSSVRGAAIGVSSGAVS